MEKFNLLHSKAIEIVARYKKTESELLDVLGEIDKTKAYLKLGYTSLFDYTVKALKLSESVAYNFITVSRKASLIPQLKTAIQEGSLTVSKARKITSVITAENQDEWILKASDLSSKALEKEVAKVIPLELKPERTKYVREDRVNLTLNLSEAYFKKLKRVQDLESQRTSKAVNIEEAFMAMIDLYLEKKDPIEKAKRNATANKTEPVSIQVGAQGSLKKNDQNLSLKRQREPISSQLRHHINLRDQGRCTHENCNQERWIDIHHIIPVSKEGQNTLENLRTLCSAHHQMEHQQSEELKV